MRQPIFLLTLLIAAGLGFVSASCGGDDEGAGSNDPCEEICNAYCSCTGIGGDACVRGCLGNCNCTTNCANANACRQNAGQPPLDCAALCGP